MTELERLAQLGDKEAQGECTRKGITLPCPKCRGAVKAVIMKYDRSWVEMEYKCQRCKLSARYTQPFIMDDSAAADLSALAQWNRMSAPPVGRCAGCDNWYKGHCASGPCATMETDPGFYCGNFSPKKRDSHETPET